MAGLREVKRRIDSVQSTKQITRTMEMVSSAKIRRASDRVQAATPFANAMHEMLQRLAGDELPLHPFFEVRKERKKIVVIAVTSDRGLAGAFNMSVLKKCDRIVSICRERDVAVKMVACGKKAIAYFAHRGYETVREYRDLSADPTIDEAREIVSVCSEMYLADEADAVYMVYNHARNAADQDLMVEELLPIRPDKDAGVATRSTLAREDFENYAGVSREERTEAIEAKAHFDFEPDTTDVLKALMPYYLLTEIYHGLLDSAAAEQGARRKAMKAATDNASEMIETLTRIYNGARQSAITTEITEIVGGAAAAEK